MVAQKLLLAPCYPHSSIFAILCTSHPAHWPYRVCWSGRLSPYVPSGEQTSRRCQEITTGMHVHSSCTRPTRTWTRGHTYPTVLAIMCNTKQYLYAFHPSCISRTCMSGLIHQADLCFPAPGLVGTQWYMQTSFKCCLNCIHNNNNSFLRLILKAQESLLLRRITSIHTLQPELHCFFFRPTTTISLSHAALSTSTADTTRSRRLISAAVVSSSHSPFDVLSRSMSDLSFPV